jgi:serine/threonine-protein phosphatase 2B regulatory subunit
VRSAWIGGADTAITRPLLVVRHGQANSAVSAPELLRLKKRFMKLDKDGSGSIDKDEFLQIPQIANNPLAHRMIAIFDEE